MDWDWIGILKIAGYVAGGLVGLFIIVGVTAAAWKTSNGFKPLIRGLTLLTGRLPSLLRLAVRVILLPYLLLCEAFAFFLHLPSAAVRQQIASFKPRDGDPFPDFPLPSFEQFCNACWGPSLSYRKSWSYWREPRARAVHYSIRAGIREKIFQYYCRLVDGDESAESPATGARHQSTSISKWLRPWCDEFSRLLTPQMLDYLSHCYLNDEVSPAQFERAYHAVDEIIYRYAAQTMARGLYVRWAADYPLVSANFTVEDFRTFLARHLPATRSSATALIEFHALRELLLAAGQVRRKTLEPTEREVQLEERQLEEAKLRHQAAEAEKNRQHEKEMKILELETERLADKNRREERVQAMLDEINEVKRRNWDQHLEDRQILLIRQKYGDVDGPIAPDTHAAEAAH